VAQAISGLMSVNGTPESGPLRMGVPVVDFLTGYHAMVGVLLALAARAHSGSGQRVEATLFDTGLALLQAPHASNWFYSGRIPERMGSAHPNIVPYDCYAAADGPIFLGVVNDGQFRRLCEYLERPDLAADPRFANPVARREHRDVLRAELEGTLARYPAAELCEALMRRGVPAGVVNDVAQALTHPHAVHRQMVVQADGHRHIGVPVKLGATPGRVASLPPRLSEHADGILAELGLDAAQRAALYTERTVTPPPA
jgi:crotonobetainyl-CoA:carnitine CoA-transferase CaiB-like acyl-CoA transferase